MANTVEIVLVAKDGATVVLRGARKELDGFVAANVKAGDYAVQAGKKITTSYRDAQASALSLSRIVGIQLPEAAGKFLARTQTIAPLLNSAFSAVAVLGLVTAISQLPKIIDEVAGSFTGWDAAAQDAYKNSISLNDKYVDRLKTSRKALEDLLAAQQKAAVGAQNQFNQSAGGQLSGATGITGIVARRLFGNPATALQESASQTAFELTERIARDTLASAEAADRAIDSAIKGLEQLREEATKTRRETEALFRSIRAFSPSEGSIRGLGAAGILDLPTLHPPGIGTQTEAFLASLDFAGAAGGAQAAKDRAREFANSQAEIVGDAQLAAAKQTFDKQKALADDFARSFSNSLGAVWDDMAIRGRNVFASLANFAAGIGNSIGRSFFQAAGQRILGGSSGSGGLIGLASKIPGIGGLLGGGASFAGGLGSTAIAGGVLAPAAAPMAIGGIGAGAAGGAGILGMSAAVAIPVFGAIAAGAIFGLSRLFRNRPEAPFTTDPFANQRSRTYEFYAMDRLTNAIDRFTAKYDPVDAGKILASARARRAVREAIRTSQSEDPGWSMDTGAAFNGAL